MYVLQYAGRLFFVPTHARKKVRDHQRRTPTDDSHDHEIVYRWQMKKMAQKIE
jgi:hypothetical protein